jgi:hypothetical protein
MKQTLRSSATALLVLVSLLASLAQMSAPKTLNNGLVTWLQLDEQAGTPAFDASRSGKSAVLVNGGNCDRWGKIGWSACLNNGAPLQIPLAWQPAAFSISWWVYAAPGTVGNWTQTVGARLNASDVWQGFLFHAASCGRIYAGTERNTHLESGDGVFQAGVWQHFVFTFNRREAAVYKNGTRIGLG